MNEVIYAIVYLSAVSVSFMAVCALCVCIGILVTVSVSVGKESLAYYWHKGALPVWRVKLWYWVVRHLPKRLLYFSFMHVMAHATTGEYGSTEAPSLSGMDAIKRFGDDFNL